MTSKLVHCWANNAGCRCGKVAMQPTARRTFLVTTASADSSGMDSNRGFANRLSPTQTESNAPESSPRLAMSKSSGTVTAPMITPRLASVSPKVPMIDHSLRVSIAHGWHDAKSDHSIDTYFYPWLVDACYRELERR